MLLQTVSLYMMSVTVRRSVLTDLMKRDVMKVSDNVKVIRDQVLFVCLEDSEFFLDYVVTTASVVLVSQLI